MAHLVRGLANAYQNQLNWQALHERNIDAGSTSLFGMNTIIPHIRNMWNHAMFVPALAKGFVFGEELEEVPMVDLPGDLENTLWGEDMQAYHDAQQEINRLKVDSLEDQIMGVLTLNLGRFNEGRAAREAIAHAEAKQDHVILPGRTADGSGLASGQEQAGLNFDVPNVPRDLAQTIERG